MFLFVYCLKTSALIRNADNVPSRKISPQAKKNWRDDMLSVTSTVSLSLFRGSVPQSKESKSGERLLINSILCTIPPSVPDTLAQIDN